MRLVVALAAGLVATGGVTGCTSKYVDAVVVNKTGAAVSLVEVDYPNASFGKDSLASGAEYHYRFKVIGSGATKVLWTDSKQVEHTVAGPKLEEGMQGSLKVTITPDGAQWDAQVKP